MKFQKQAQALWMGSQLAAVLVLSVLTACNKAKPPPPNLETSPSLPVSSITNSKQALLAWNTRTLVDAYEKVGRKHPTWDEPAKRALAEFARGRARVLGSNEPMSRIIGTNADAAIALGCDDPLVLYVHARYSQGELTTNALAYAEALRKSSEALQQSRYHEIRKFYAALKTAGQYKSLAGGNTTNIPPAVHLFRRIAVTNLLEALADKALPVQEVDDACHEILAALEMNKSQYGWCYHGMEELLFANWPEESVAWLLKGTGHLRLAWHARGGGYADTVTEEGWRSFKEQLKIAEDALNRAWEINPKDPRIAVKMIWVELGQGQGRKRMEMWFQRAMALDPNCYDACAAKVLYLEPKWHGSVNEMLEFGRECVKNKAWGGRVPLVLVDAHEDVLLYATEKSKQAAYWQKPEVWPDIKAAFERFFEVSPQLVGWRHNYARYAYRCKQWDDLNRQLPLLGPVNYDYFGGKAEFDKLVREAKAHASN